jgi:hypothetical protein
MRQWVDGRTKTTGDFYRDEAARVVLDAARLQLQAAQLKAAAEPAPAYIPPVLLDEPKRAPLSPQPALNQNADVRSDRPAAEMRTPERAPRAPIEDDEPGMSVGRVIAWVVLAPWYLAVAVAAIGVDVLFVKDLLGF